MKDKEKQIEEMVKDKLIKVILQSGGLTINMFGRGERIIRADVDKLANNLIESGLIIPEDSVVLSKELLEVNDVKSVDELVIISRSNLMTKLELKGKEANKETAEKIYKEYLCDILSLEAKEEFAKQFKVGLK